MRRGGASLLLAAAVTVRADAASLYLDAAGWAYTEPVPISDYLDDWRAPLGKGSDGFAFLHLESGVRHQGWRVGWALQRQYVIEASRGAAALYHLEQNDQPTPAEQRYDADVIADYYEVRGLRLGREIGLLAWRRLTLRVEPVLGLWEGLALEDGRLAGTATTDAAGELAYSATLDHFYHRDALLDRPVSRPRGRGASLDLRGDWQVGTEWSGDFELRNALGRIWWRDAPFTLGVLTSDTRQTGADGSVDFAPTLSGFEGNRSHRQRMPLFAQASALRQVGAHAFGVSLVHTEVGRVHGLRWLHARGALRYGLQWLPDARDAVEVHVAWNALRLDVGSSAWRWDDAEQLHLRLGLEIPLHRG